MIVREQYHQKSTGIEFADPFGFTPKESFIDPYAAIEGALEDIALQRQELGYAQGDMEQEAFDTAVDEINHKVQNIYDVASDYYDPNLAEGMAVFNEIARKVEAMGCNHNHFMEQTFGKQDSDGRYDHDHSSLSHDSLLSGMHTDDDEDEDSKFSKDKKSKRRRLSLYELLIKILNNK